jgi:hypothetical protein
MLIVLLMLAAGLAGCGHSGSSTAPSTPAPVPPVNPIPAAGTLLVFTESASGFATSDLRDAQDQIVRFNTAGELIWVTDGTRLPGFKVTNDREYSIEGKICSVVCFFVVRFGTKDGERRAYLTVDYIHDNPGTLVDVEVADRSLVVTETDLFPPGSPTLSGVVTEITPTGPTLVRGVSVYRLVISGWRSAITDDDGSYRIRGLIEGVAAVSIVDDRYVKKSSEVLINGDTRFDIELVRR